MLIGAFTIVGAVIGLVGSWQVLVSYEAERKEAEREQEEKRGLRADLSAAHRELSEARARNDAAELRRKRQLEKLSMATRRVAEAIDEGDGIRYKFEHERNTNVQKFAEEFETVHAKAVEDWRGKTARMLDEELPSLRLGSAFSSISGERVGRPDVYEPTRLLNCIAELRAIQRNLPAYVAQVVE